MRYLALASDYDGTLAHNGRVTAESIEALKRLRKSGRRVILVTGRILADLHDVAPDLELFDLVVAENGALLYDPRTREETLLAAPPAAEFVAALRERGVVPLDVGRSIVATWHPYETVVIETIARLGLDLQITFNKGAVMVLPGGVTKATGLLRALERLELSTHNAVAVGDAENDLTMLAACEAAVAVGNAIQPVKDRCDLVTQAERGEGVVELIDRLLDDDLASINPQLERHAIVFGRNGADELRLPAYGGAVLVTGSSGGGKSTLAAACLERIVERGYQCCVIDPEGDYEGFPQLVPLGDVDRAATNDEIAAVLATVDRSVIVNLLAVPIDERPRRGESLLGLLVTMRARTGRPNWIIIDEAHHLFPHDWDTAATLPGDVANIIFVTVDPSSLAPRVLDIVESVLAVGAHPEASIEAVCRCVGSNSPPPQERADDAGLYWTRRQPDRLVPFSLIAGNVERRRHRRKYATGDLAPDKSFYFTGPNAALHLRAKNLVSFAELARGVDDDTWTHHLRRGDVSRWLREEIGDGDLGDEVARVETDTGLDAKASRAEIIDAIERRYTAPA